MTTQTPDKALAIIEKESAPVIQRAASLVDLSITSPAEMTAAAELLSQLNRYADKLKARKEEITKPLNAALKSARELFKPREDILSTSITALRGTMGRYQLEAERKAKIEEEKLANRIGEGKGKLKPETAVRKLGEIDRPEAKVEAASGTVKFRTSHELIIDDMDTLIAHIFAKKLDLLVEIIDANLVEHLKTKPDMKIPGAHLEERRTVINNRS